MSTPVRTATLSRGTRYFPASVAANHGNGRAPVLAISSIKRTMRTRSGFVFGAQVCAELSEAGGADREWLLTDATGGYALGTVTGLRTRRQHALLVTPGGRVALVTLDPVVTLTSGVRVKLGVHEW